MWFQSAFGGSFVLTKVSLGHDRVSCVEVCPLSEGRFSEVAYQNQSGATGLSAVWRLSAFRRVRYNLEVIL